MTGLIMPDLVDLTGLSDDDAYELGETLYAETFLNQSDRRGELLTHDGMPLIFWWERYDHAFTTSSDRVRRAHDKDIVARTRIARFHWILKLLACVDDGIKCKQLSPPDRWKRAYYSLEHGHIVWLEQAKMQGGRPTAWKFSSSYNVPAEEIKRTTQRGRILKG